jgi:putative membrane protein
VTPHWLPFAFAVSDLPAVNAALNATATVLLVAGYVLIKRRNERAHKVAMLAAFGVSVAFLVCYLVYHFHAGSVRFQGPSAIRTVYLAILISHIILAATVPFLAGASIYFGLRDNRRAHLRVSRWTFPIWLYVSVTGVVIYWMLYHAYPPPAVGL